MPASDAEVSATSAGSPELLEKRHDLPTLELRSPRPGNLGLVDGHGRLDLCVDLLGDLRKGNREPDVLLDLPQPIQLGRRHREVELVDPESDRSEARPEEGGVVGTVGPVKESLDRCREVVERPMTRPG